MEPDDKDRVKSEPEEEVPRARQLRPPLMFAEDVPDPRGRGPQRLQRTNLNDLQ